MNTISINPLRQVAISLGLMERGSRDLSQLPIAAYRAIGEELNTPHSSRLGTTHGMCGLSDEAGRILARALLGRDRVLRTLSFVCVSDYVGGVRYEKQGRQFALSCGERQMLDRAVRLHEICESGGIELDWKLILADAWGQELYPDRLVPGGIDSYVDFMTRECTARGFPTIRWSRFMQRHGDLYQEGLRLAEAAITPEMISWEAGFGEIAHDRPERARAKEIARQHILMRATESYVLRHVSYGAQMIVLSTEGPSLRRYDNLVVARSEYVACDFMPKYPHRLDY